MENPDFDARLDGLSNPFRLEGVLAAISAAILWTGAALVALELASIHRYTLDTVFAVAGKLVLIAVLLWLAARITQQARRCLWGFRIDIAAPADLTNRGKGGAGGSLPVGALGFLLDNGAFPNTGARPELTDRVVGENGRAHPRIEVLANRLLIASANASILIAAALIVVLAAGTPAETMLANLTRLVLAAILFAILYHSWSPGAVLSIRARSFGIASALSLPIAAILAGAVIARVSLPIDPLLNQIAGMLSGLVVLADYTVPLICLIVLVGVTLGLGLLGLRNHAVLRVDHQRNQLSAANNELKGRVTARSALLHMLDLVYPADAPNEQRRIYRKYDNRAGLSDQAGAADGAFALLETVPVVSADRAPAPIGRIAVRTMTVLGGLLRLAGAGVLEAMLYGLSLPDSAAGAIVLGLGILPDTALALICLRFGACLGAMGRLIAGEVAFQSTLLRISIVAETHTQAAPVLMREESLDPSITVELRPRVEALTLLTSTIARPIAGRGGSLSAPRAVLGIDGRSDLPDPPDCGGRGPCQASAWR